MEEAVADQVESVALTPGRDAVVWPWIVAVAMERRGWILGKFRR